MERPNVIEMLSGQRLRRFVHFHMQKMKVHWSRPVLKIFSPLLFKVTFGCSYHSVHSWKRCFWSPDQNRYQSLDLFSWKRCTSVKLRDTNESSRWLLNGDSRSRRTRLWWKRVCVYVTAGVLSSLVLRQKTSNISCLGLFVRESFFHKVLP